MQNNQINNFLEQEIAQESKESKNWGMEPNMLMESVMVLESYRARECEKVPFEVSRMTEESV